MRYQLKCTVHDFEFGFGAPPAGVEAAFLQCPLCAREELMAQQAALEKITAHRDLLLQAIDLKRTIVRNGR